MAEHGRQAPEAAKAWIETLPPSGVRRLATRRLAETWADQEPQAAATWLLSQGPEVLDQSGWDWLGKKWALNQADGFKSFAMENGERMVTDLLTSGIMILAEKDGPGAIEWAVSLPETVRTEAVDAAWVNWGRFDAPAAAAYLGAQPNAPLSERAVSRFARNWARRDAAATAAWVTSLPSGPLRDAAQRELP